ncbi:MAG TPA: hypothetical protein VJK04_00135 [Candidatus Paceibacterota bacterium]
MPFNETPPTPKLVHERIQEAKEESSRRVGVIERHQRVFDFAIKIQKQHPDYIKYRAYHQLISSTPPDDVIEGDFEGDDSVEKFFKSLV